MGDSKVEKLIKISELKAKKNIEINRIGYENLYLVPCQVTIKKEEVEFIYDLDGLESLNGVKNRKQIEKLKLAINISHIFEILDEYSFNLNPDNLYYDYNYNIKVLERDIRLAEEVIDIQDMHTQYKSIIGYIFDDKYSYEDFYLGGLDLIKINELIKKYLSMDDIKEIRNELLLDLKNREKYEKENYIEERLRNVKIKKYSLIAMGAVILALGAYTVYNTFFLNPLYKNIIKANSYFMQQDYEGVIKSLENTRGLNLDKDSKYKLAYSYIISENLSDTQKKNIMSNLNAKSDENILDYWIALGKSKYDVAIDLAKKVQDDEMVLYALIHKDKYIQDNSKLSGEAKQKQQQAIKSEIEELTKQLGESDKKAENTSGGSTNTSNSGTGSLNLAPSTK